MRHSWTILLGILVVCEIQCRAQETVFNVPSADVLSRGIVYGEFDTAVRPSDPSFAFTPRVVVGFGHSIEAGVNFLGPAEPATGEYILSPAIKWRFYDGRNNGWSAFAGDNLFVPVHNLAYHVGTYTYLEVARRFGSGTRIGAGGFYFSPHVVANASRAGGQFSVEQKISSTLTLAADWFTGNHADGYLTPGVVWSATNELTFYGAYEVGNAGVLNGNHGLLLEVGYTF